MEITFMQPGEEDQVIDLVETVFDEFIAPGYSDEGVEEFYQFANANSLAQRSKADSFTLIARDNRHMAGIIEIRNLTHISMLFVRSEHQKKGIGKKLLNRAVEQIKITQHNVKGLTVNSSPNAVPAYEHFGFKTETAEQCVSGIRFIPMKLEIRSYPHI